MCVWKNQKEFYEKNLKSFFTPLVGLLAMKYLEHMKRVHPDKKVLTRGEAR